MHGSWRTARVRGLAITNLQAKALTRTYSYVRRTGVLETSLGQKVFTTLYFFYKSRFEDPFRAFTRRRPELFKGGHVFDVGANIGYTSTVFAGVVEHGYHVFAFEPEPSNFRLLQRTLAERRLNQCVIPVYSAVGETQGNIGLWLNADHHADHRVATPEWRA